MDRLFKIHCSKISKIMGNGKGDGLPVTCQTFLKEWYCDEREQIWSKYTDKGNIVEADLIDFMAEQLGFGLAEKNQETRQDDYMIGTCDVAYPNLVVDGKAPWNIKTLQSNIGGIDSDYEWQGIGYMRLWEVDEFILFYGLMDTPAECNYDREVIYSNLPDQDRWIAYRIKRNKLMEDAIVERVKACRLWLDDYDQDIKEKMGKVHDL